MCSVDCAADAFFRQTTTTRLGMPARRSNCQFPGFQPCLALTDCGTEKTPIDCGKKVATLSIWTGSLLSLIDKHPKNLMTVSLTSMIMAI
jgi:hypothetical protein